MSTQNEAISLVAMCSNELWLVQENHATVKLHRPRNGNLHQKQNWIAKFTNLEENAGNVKSVFVIRAALWAENWAWTSPWISQEFKNTLGKLAVAVNFGVTKLLASLRVILNFFFYFSKKSGSVGPWETKHFMGMALSKMFYGHAMLIGGGSRYLSFPVYRCRVPWIQKLTSIWQHYSHSVFNFYFFGKKLVGKCPDTYSNLISTLLNIDAQSYPALTSQSLHATIGLLQDNWPLFTTSLESRAFFHLRTAL